MADKNLELALRIKADAKQATAEIGNFNSEVADVSNAAATATAATTELANTAENTGKKFVYAGQSVFSLRDAVQQSDSAAKQFANTTNAVAAETEKAAQKFVFAGKSTFSLRDGLQAVTVSSKDQATELARLLSTYDGASVYTQRLARDEALLKKAMDEGRISADQYQRSIVALQRRNQQLSSSYGSLRGQMSNVGFQLQDIAVQMQMGVNPAVILAQQGSQLVSGFNPLAGAVIAVGGALVGALIPGLMGSSDASEQLNTKIKDLNKSYETLTVNQRASLANEQRDIQKSLNDRKKDIQEEIAILERRVADLQRAQENPSFTSGASGAFLRAPTEGQIEKLQTQNARNLGDARTELDNKTQELAETEKELRRINGEKVVDEQELIKKTNELIESLEKETDTYGLVGEALGKYIADELKAIGATRERIIELYRKREAQKQATEAEREAEAEAEKAASKAKARQDAAVEYVRNLERQAAAIGMTAQEAADAESAHRGVTGELLKQAQAAQQLIQADKDRLAIAELNIQLLRAQGREQEATQAEFEQRYGEMLERLQAKSDSAGLEIIKKIIDLKALDIQLSEVEKRFQKSLENLSRQESSINTQREAGLISEYEARRQIYELHQAQAAELEKLRPSLEELSKQPGAVGEAATTAIAALDDEILRLKSTMDLLQSTLRDGLETGLTNALLGLADGTMTLRDAINALGQSVAQALAQMAAEALAQQAIAALFNKGENKDSGQAMKEGAAATTLAAGALSIAAAQVLASATAMQAAAAALAAANASGGGGGSSGGSSGGGWVSTLFNAAASYYAADGGHITGPGTSTSDSIPAMLSDNEFVTRAAVVGQPGALDFLHDFNSRGMSALRDWAPAYHNTGGLAGVPAPAMPSPTMGASLSDPSVDQGAGAGSYTNRILNVVDPELIEEHLNSAAGDQIFVNMIKRNTAMVQRIAGTSK